MAIMNNFKTIALNLIQGVLLILYAVLGFLSRGFFGDFSGISDLTGQLTGMLSSLFTPSFVDSLVYIIPLVLVLMILTFIGYSLVAGILASITTNTEDFQQLLVKFTVGMFLEKLWFHQVLQLVKEKLLN